MPDNPVIFALITYGLTIIIALLVAGLISIIGWAVKAGDKKAAKEAKE